jgi:hypothetical protein
MLNKDFYGKNSFVWWTGVVEDRDDPLQLGSIRVRIIGLHSDDKSLVPTDSLPWAQVLQAPTGASTTSGPREGDWVFGFFQDGDYAQIPVVVGVFPGIESSQSQTIYNEITVKKGASKTPRPSQVDRVLGEPTTVRMSRGQMEGTLTNFLNGNLSHACDVKKPIEFAVRWANLTNSTIVQGLVTTIKGLATSLGSDASGLVSTAIHVLKKIQSFLRYVQDILQTVQDFVFVGIEYARIARAVVDYINNLPNRLQRFLRECLAKVVAGVLSVITTLFSTEGFAELGDFNIGELTTEFNNTLTELNKTGSELVQTITLPSQFIEALVNPSSSENQDAAGKILDGVVGAVSNNGQSINNQTQFKKTTSIP